MTGSKRQIIVTLNEKTTGKKEFQNQNQMQSNMNYQQPQYNQNNQQPQNGYEGNKNYGGQTFEQNRQQPINVQPVQYQTFDDSKILVEKKNLGLIMDVPLEVTVELGRTNKLIKDILEFGQGSIIQLDKLAGEPVDILVNGKIIAKGEVVVIDESFGVRITDIIPPSGRI